MDFLKFKPRTRRPGRYVAALLEEALRLRIIEKEVVFRTDKLLHAFAARLIAQKNHKKKDAHTRCEASLRYVVGFHLRTQGDHEHALQLLCALRSLDDLEAMYQSGAQLLHKRYLLAASRYVITKKTMLSLPNLAYQKTMSEQIPQFLQHYDPSINAHAEEFSLSYPTAIPIRNYTGLTRILRYLQALYAENLFLAQFPAEELEYFYLSYCFSHQLYDVELPIVNLFRIAFKNALIAEYLRLEPGTLLLPQKEVQTAQRILFSLSEQEQTEILHACAQRLLLQSLPYYSTVSDSVLCELLTAIRRQRLSEILVVESN